MSRVVDERIVSMQFDNKNFEKNVQTSMGTLDKLKQSLNLKGASNGLESVTAATDELVKSEYAAYQSGFRLKDIWLKMASVFEYQVAGRIISSAKNMVKAFTIDPVKTGLSEYETQLNAVQTILANTESKGSTLDDVNKALDELNTYADKTIYNFTEMTRNIGTFTAAGVELETSVQAIKGIANLAAVSGSTSQQASTAMYQLSQALSSGTVRLMDWNSVVNAGMGGQVFQDALKETARVHGVAIDDIIEKQGSFRESLSEGWLSSEILLETLNKFTGDLSEEQLKSMGYTEQQIAEIMKLGQTANDAATKVKTFTQLLDTLKEAAQSGWAQTWELIIGDFGEAKELWTNVSNVLGGIISKSAEARNQLISGTLNSGWKQFLGEGIMNEEGYTKYLKDIASQSGVSIDKMIEQEGSLEKALRKGLQTGDLKPGMFSAALKKLTNTYSKLSDEELKNLGYTREQVEELKKLNEGIQNGSISMEEFTDKMSKLSGRELIIESFKNVWEALLSVVRPIKEAFTEIFPPTTADQLYKILEAIKNFTDKLKLSEEQSAKLKQTFKGLFSAVDIVFTVIKTFASTIVKLIGNFAGLGDGVLSVGAALGDFFTNLRNSVKESNILAKISNVIVAVFTRITDVIKAVTNAIGNLFGSNFFGAIGKALTAVWNLVKDIFSKIGGVFTSTFGGDGKGFGAALLDALNAGLLTTLIVKFKGFIDSFENITETFTGFKDGVKDFFGSIKTSITDFSKAMQTNVKTKAMQNVAIALAILAASLLVLSFIDEDKLANSLVAIAFCLGTLIVAMKQVDGFDPKKKSVSIMKLVGVATALLILSFALAKLGKMSWGEIARGIIGMTAGLGAMVGTLALLSKIKSTTKMAQEGAKQLNKIALSMIPMAITMKILASIDWGGIARGLVGIVGGLGAMVGALAVMSKIKGTKMAQDGAKQLKTMAFSLLPLAVALKLLATIGWGGIGRSLTGIGGTIAILVGAMFAMSKIKSNTKMAQEGPKQLQTMTFALLPLAIALKILSTIDWGGIGRGLVGIGGTIAILVGAMAIMSKIKATKMAQDGAKQLQTMTFALLPLAIALKILASIGWDGIGRSLVAMVGSLGILVATFFLMSKIPTGSVIKSAAAVLIMSAALGALVPVLFMLGNMNAGTIITSLLTIAATFAIFGVAAMLLQPVAPTMMLIAAAFAVFGVGCLAVGAGIALVCAGIAALVTAVVAGGAAVIATVVQLAKELINLIPFIGTKLGEAVVAFAGVITQGAPAIAEAIATLLITSLEMLDIPRLATTLLNIALGVLEAFAEFTPKLVESLFKIVAGIFTGVIDALKSMGVNDILELVAGIGIVEGLIALLGAIAGMIPAAMVGVLGMGLVIAELAIVLAAIGLLTKIPGLMEFVERGGDLLEKIGTAIGQFIGGIVGGIAQGFTNSMPDIGTDLSNFMKNVTPFLNGIKNIDSNLLSNTKTLIGAILAITGASLVEKVMSWITGDSSMADFATELVAFGEGLSEFAKEVNDIDPDKVEAAAKAGKILSEMAETIPESGGLLQWFGGENDLSSFATGIADFGEGLSDFGEKVDDVDPDKITAAAKAAKTLSEMVKQVESLEIDNLSTFSDELPNLGSSISSFTTNIGDIKTETIAQICTDINDLVATLATVNANGIKEVINSFNRAEVTISNAATGMIKGALLAIKNSVSNFKEAGVAIMTSFAGGIIVGTLTVANACDAMIKTVKSSISNADLVAGFKNSGKYAAIGFANGMTSNMFYPMAAARALAKKALQAANNAMGVESPSKEFYKTGLFCAEGLTNALYDSQSEVYKSGYNLGDYAKKGLQKVISTASDFIENGVDVQPTIRPVLDLSEVRSGANSINSMFGMNPSVGVLARVNSIGSSMNKIQNSGNDDVVSAIKDLEGVLGNTSGDTYNINGVTAGSDEEVKAAINTIVRAAIVGGRR